VTKLEEVVRAICHQSGCALAKIGKPCIGSQGQRTGCQASINQLVLTGMWACAERAVEALPDATEGQINACFMEPTADRLAYYRAMIAAVLNEKPDTTA
jgi:hypothetical protein